MEKEQDLKENTDSSTSETEINKAEDQKEVESKKEEKKEVTPEEKIKDDFYYFN